MDTTVSRKIIYMKNFLKCLDEFINSIDEKFPNDVDVTYARNGIEKIKKSNPRILIEYWLNYVYLPNKDKIHNNDISFIIDGDHRVLDGVNGGTKVRDAIFRLKEPISKLDEPIKNTLGVYILNMSKLSILYFS